MKHLSVLIALIVTLSTFGLVSAQDELTDESIIHEIEGELIINEQGDLMVGPVIIAPAGAFNPSDYETGDTVIITGYLLNDTTLQAITIEIVVEAPVATEEPMVTEEPMATEEPMVTEEPAVEIITTGAHPVASAIATTFEIEYDTVESWHINGLGYGQISRAVLLADQVDDLTFQEAIELVQGGTNLSQLARDYGLSPSDLAPGQIISGRYSADSDMGEDGDIGYISVNITVNIRAGSGTDTEIIGSLQPGTEFTIIGIEGDWYIVLLADGTTGYIFADLVGEGEAPEVIVDDGGTVQSSNQGQVIEGEVNKFGCEGRGNSCNAPGQNRGNGNGNGNN